MIIHAIVPIPGEPILTPTDLAVWVALCSFAQWKYVKGSPTKTKDGSCFPTDRAIAERAHCSIRSVKRSIKTLESLVLVVRAPRHGEDGEQRSNDYTLFADPQPKLAEREPANDNPRPKAVNQP